MSKLDHDGETMIEYSSAHIGKLMRCGGVKLCLDFRHSIKKVVSFEMNYNKSLWGLRKRSIFFRFLVGCTEKKQFSLSDT